MGPVKRFFLAMYVLSLRVLPRKVSIFLASATASCVRILNPRLKTAVEKNLRCIGVPDKDIQATIRKTFKSFAIYMTEFFSAQYFLPDMTKRKAEIEGDFEAFKQYMSEGGVILVSAHFANPYVGTAYFEKFGFRSLSVVLAPHLELTELVYPDRRDPPLRESIKSSHAFKRCVRAVRDEGKLLTLLADRPLAEKGAAVEMFGHTIYLPLAPARLALIADVPLVSGFVIRKPDGFYKLWFGPRIMPPESDSNVEKARLMMQEYARSFETCVRSHPEQWHIFFPIFDPPEGKICDPAFPEQMTES